MAKGIVRKSLFVVLGLMVILLTLQLTGIFDPIDYLRPSNRRSRWIDSNLSSYQVHENDNSLAAEECTKILLQARSQLETTKRYDPSYKKLNFPAGDVALDVGVCADVVVRALRSIGIDLQKEINADIRSRKSEYPNLWFQLNPDSSIDHRRVPNIMAYFQKHGSVLILSKDSSDYKPCDVVAWDLGSGITHIGIVTDKKENGKPLVIHHLPGKPKEEAVLTDWKIIGHYSISKPTHTDRNPP